MANYDNLIASIKGAIKNNNTQAITGQVLQDTLVSIVESTQENTASADQMATANTYIRNNAGTIAVLRATVTLSGSKVTVGAGDAYFYFANGEVSAVSFTEQNFTLASSQGLVYNTVSRSLRVATRAEWGKDDIVVLMHDGVKGICGGLWWPYIKISEIGNTGISADDVGLRDKSIGIYAKTNVANAVELFDTSFAVAGEELEYSFELTGVSGNIALLDSAGTRLQSIGVGGGGVAGQVVKGSIVVASGFSVAKTQWGAIKNVFIKNRSKDAGLQLATKVSNSLNAGFAQGTLVYESTTGQLSVSPSTTLDFYTGCNPIKFNRLSAGTVLCTVSGTGSNVVSVDPATLKFYAGSNNKAASIAYYSNGVFAPVGRVRIQYKTNGVITKDVQYPYIPTSTNETTDGLPSFVTTEAISTFQRVMNWLGSNRGWMIGHITDVHSTKSLQQYKHVGYLNELNKTFGFGLMCHAGDIGLDVGETASEAYELLAKTKTAMQSVSPWVLCKGNHDYGTQKISQQTIGNIFNIATQRQHNIVLGSKDGGYGYYDDPNNKVRTFFLNTSDGDTGAYTMSAQQLSWFIAKLGETAEGWRVVVLTHFCPVESLGKWASSTNTSYSAAQFVSLRGILSSFVAKTSGSNSSLGLTWNFGSAKASLVCVLSGDSHFNNMGVVDGVRYIIRQGYGGASASDIPSGGSFDSFSVTNSCLFDVLVVSESKAGIFRIGAGGQTRDVTFNI